MSLEEQKRFAKEQAESEMPCPKCKTMHRQGEYLPWSDGPIVFYAPADVECPCGLVIEVVVPLVKMDPYGWHWGVKPDDRSTRLLPKDKS